MLHHLDHVACAAMIVLGGVACGPPQPTAAPPQKPLAGGALGDGSEVVKPDARYLFYLHGQIVEGSDGTPEHRRFGVYEYERIVSTLREQGLEVVSQVRPAGTEVRTYAEQIVDQVERLIAAGVPPQHITVAGHSKGGVIAVFASSILDHPKVNFVFLACCGDWLGAPDAPAVNGRVLSIYEASDELGRSCQPAFERARAGSVHSEIEIAIGGGHGAFYRPDPAWIEPLVEWVQGAGTAEEP